MSKHTAGPREAESRVRNYTLTLADERGVVLNQWTIAPSAKDYDAQDYSHPLDKHDGMDLVDDINREIRVSVGAEGV